MSKDARPRLRAGPDQAMSLPAVERGGNTLHGITDVRTENGSSQRRNLALPVLYVPYSLVVAEAALDRPPRPQRLSFFKNARQQAATTHGIPQRSIKRRESSLNL